MGTALLCIRCQVGQYYKCVQFEFNNNILSYMKNDSERKTSISLYYQVICLFDIPVKVIYFNFGIIVEGYYFLQKYCIYYSISIQLL